MPRWRTCCTEPRSSPKSKRLMNVLGVTDRISLDGQLDGRRRYRVGCIAGAMFQANQFRLFLHMGAYWLLHTLRRTAPRRSVWRGATFETIRRTFVKIAVRVEELKTRIRLSLPTSCPNADMLAAICNRITVRSP